MNAPSKDLIAWFGDETEGHVCCECCGGYCSFAESGIEPGPGILAAFPGYISDRYVAVREGLVTVPGDAEVLRGDKTPEFLLVPAEKAGSSTATFLPSRVTRLWALGVEICAGEADDKPQHLYLDGQHIGWIMPTPNGAALDTIRDLAWQVDGWGDQTTNPLQSVVRALGMPRIDGLWAFRKAVAEDQS